MKRFLTPVLLCVLAAGLGALANWGYHQRAPQAASEGPRLRAGDHSAVLDAHGEALVFYSLSTCRACAQTREHLNARGVRFAELQLDASESARVEAKALGAQRVPLVLSRSASLEGFDADLLDRLLSEAGVEVRAAAQPAS